jgi:hypothetical protein
MMLKPRSANDSTMSFINLESRCSQPSSWAYEMPRREEHTERIRTPDKSVLHSFLIFPLRIPLFHF